MNLNSVVEQQLDEYMAWLHRAETERDRERREPDQGDDPLSDEALHQVVAEGYGPDAEEERHEDYE